MRGRKGASEGFTRIMQRKILAFHRDEQGHWVAELECGHHQHVRHRPPWINRPWVVSEEGRQRHIGRRLNCKVCDLEQRSEDRQDYHTNY